MVHRTVAMPDIDAVGGGNGCLNIGFTALHGFRHGIATREMGGDR